MDPKKQLQKLIDDLKTKKYREGEGKGLIEAIQEEQTKALKPVLEAMAKEISENATNMFKEAVSNIKVELPEIKSPEVTVNVPDIKIPEIKLPQINIPRALAPIVNIPETKFDFPDLMKVLGEVSLAGVDKKNPLPVIMMGSDGKPFQININPGGGGGKTDFFTIQAFGDSAFSNLQNGDGRLKVSVEAGGSGLTDAELRASAVPVSQVSGSAWSTTIQDVNASALASFQNGDGRIRVSVETGGSGLTDSELRASAVPVTQVSGAGWSVSVTDVFGTTGANVVNPDGRVKVELPSGASGLTDTELRASSVPVTQASGAIWSMTVQDSQGSTITSHQTKDGDFRGLDTNIIGVYNVESILNTSTATLAGAGTFTGLAEEVINFSSISISVFADQVSATDGLSIQQSSNGTNWDITDTFTIPASTGKVYSVQPVARYFRIVYINGGSAQGAFRLYTVFHYFAAQPSSQRTSDAYTNETDMQQFWGFNSMFNGSTWDRMRANAGDSAGALRVVNAVDAVSSVNIMSQGVSIVTQQLSGAAHSVNVIGPIAQGDAATALRVVVAGNSDMSTVVNSGTLTGITNTLTINQVSGVSFSVNALGSTAANIVDSSGVAYSGSNPVPVTVVSSQGTTAAVLTRQSNPTAVAADYVPFAADDLGRQLVRPVQVRDLIFTAYVAATTGTETTLLAASVGNFHDLIYILASNNSTAAVGIDIRSVTAGNIMLHLEIPANGTTGLSLPVPIPQDATGNNWTVDLPDITGTTVHVSALFSREL